MQVICTSLQTDNNAINYSLVLWHCWLGSRKGIRPVKLSGEALAWLPIWSEVQMICMWFSWCYCHPIISCSSKIQNGLPFWCRPTQVVLEKRPLNGCSSSTPSLILKDTHTAATNSIIRTSDLLKQKTERTLQNTTNRSAWRRIDKVSPVSSLLQSLTDISCSGNKLQTHTYTSFVWDDYLCQLWRWYCFDHYLFVCSSVLFLSRINRTLWMAFHYMRGIHYITLVAWHSGRTSVFGWQTSLSCTRPVADGWPLMWINCSL